MTSPIRTHNPQPTRKVFRPSGFALGARTGNPLLVSGQVSFEDGGSAVTHAANAETN